MTATEYRSALAALDLSQARLARILAADRNTPSRWATGRVAVPASVAILLRLALAGRLTLAQIEAA
ncbi:MAG: hypothetical protein ACREQ5_17400 [Candidatus Dormibacteria bacterium]